jgi:hypothetical protein
MADYLTLQDLYNNVGAERVLHLFDDSVDGSLTDESDEVARILEAAEAEAASHMLRGWNKDQIIALAGYDKSFLSHVAWIALELASERRPEFTQSDGKGMFWVQYERAISYVKNVSKSKQISVGESEVATNANTGGNMRPTLQTNQSRFIFAPDEENPTGHGGY